MPAEWQAHSCCWMAWPCRPDLWGERLKAARYAYAEVARTIAGYEPVYMVADPADLSNAEVLCGNSVNVLPVPLNDSWMRDTGPTFVVNDAGNVAGVDWQFNDYGNKDEQPAESYADTAALATRITERIAVKRFQAPLVLEGGSIHVDGEGTLLTSEQCLLNPNRNPDLSRQQIETALCDFTGSKQVIWLGQGLLDDDTDGHVDNLACFVKPGTVMALTCNDSDDENYAALQDNLARLRQATDAHGRQLEIIEVEQPEKRVNPLNGLRLAMSYINFYIANSAIIVPGFDQPERDAAAVSALTEAFPDRDIVQVPGLDIIVGGGNVHCITQQQPRGARS